MLIPFDHIINKYKIQPIGVFHCGASLGQEIEAYYNNGIKYTFWIEADPVVYEGLKINIAKYPNADSLCVCVSDTNQKEVDFNIANNEGQSSSLLEFGTHSTEHPTVKFINKIKLPTVRLDSLIEKFGWDMDKYDFLNIDLQGAELLALKGMGKYLKGFKYLYIEVNSAELYKGCPMVEDIDEYVLQYGFKRVETKWTDWKWGDAYYSKTIT